MKTSGKMNPTEVCDEHTHCNEFGFCINEDPVHPPAQAERCQSHNDCTIEAELAQRFPVSEMSFTYNGLQIQDDTGT
eukprot:403375628